VSVFRRFTSGRSLDAAVLVALGLYLIVIRLWGVSETLWMLADQIRDWRLALGPFSGLPLTGTSSTAGGASLGPIYYWVLWISRVVIGPLTANLPHAGVYGIAALQTAADILLFTALRRRPIPLMASAATVLLGGCVSSQPDYTPFGDGMKAIGISLVIYGVVKALADLVMADDKQPKDQPERKARKTRETKSKGGDT